MTDPLEALRRRFRERCAGDLAVLRQCLRAPGAASTTELQVLVHQMSGAAGAFGFPRLSSLAARLDNQLSAGEPPSREPVLALIDELVSMEGEIG